MRMLSLPKGKMERARGSTSQLYALECSSGCLYLQYLQKALEECVCTQRMSRLTVSCVRAS